MSRFSALDWKRTGGLVLSMAVIVAAAGLAIWPQLRHGYSCGHDFDFHLVSWFEALDSWHRGLFYPHWTISPNYGAGEPRFVFYPPITWMLGAALRATNGWYFVPINLAWILLAGTGLATWALARQLVSNGAAVLAGCTAIFSGYALFTTYERSAFGELTGGFWIPLLLLLILRDRKPAARALERALDGSAWLLALAMAGAWLSNVPLGVIASYLLAAAALGAAIVRRTWAPVIRASAGAIGGIGLASIYLFPATSEQKWVDVAQATNDPGSRIENSWLFARHSDPALESHDTVLLRVSAIAVTMIAVAMAGLLIAWLRGRLKARREWWILLGLLPAAVLLLQLPISLTIWNLLPKLRLLQFPWRWLVVLEAPMGIFFSAALWPVRLWRQIVVAVVCAGFFAGATYFAWKAYFQPCEGEDSISSMLAVYRAGTGFDGIDEYEPPNADDSQVPTGLPGACLAAQPKAELAAPVQDSNPEWDESRHTCKATFPSQWVAPEHLRIAADAPQEGYLILRLRSYPAWQITVNGRQVTPFDQREDGLMAVPVPQGRANVDVEWMTTGDAIAGRWVSGITLLLLAGLFFIERKQARPQLS